MSTTRKVRNRMPTGDLANQDDSFLDDYIAYYDLPGDLNRKDVIPLLCSARSTVPILPHLLYDELENGMVRFTGRVDTKDTSKGNKPSAGDKTLVYEPSGSNVPAGGPAASKATSSWTGMDLKPAPGRDLVRGSRVFLAAYERQQRLDQAESDAAALAAEAVTEEGQANGTNDSEAAPEIPSPVPVSTGLNLHPVPGRRLVRWSHVAIAENERRQRLEQAESDAAALAAGLAAEEAQANVPHEPLERTIPRDEPYSGMNLEPTPEWAFQRGSLHRSPLAEAKRRRQGEETAGIAPHTSEIVTGPGSPELPSFTGRPPPSPRPSALNVATSPSQRPRMPLSRRVLIASPTNDVYEDPPVVPYQTPPPFSGIPQASSIPSVSSRDNSPAQEAPVEENAPRPRPPKPEVLIPFPRIEDSPSSSASPPLPDNEELFGPPLPSSQETKGPRFAYPPTIKGDWLDVMLRDVASGRKDVKVALEEAKQQVRLAIEEVMKAQMEAHAETKEWDGFMRYLKEIVGADWIAGLERAAKEMGEYGSDYDGSDDGNDEGRGGGEGDYPGDGGDHPNGGGNLPSDEEDDNEDHPSDAENQPRNIHYSYDGRYYPHDDEDAKEYPSDAESQPPPTGDSPHTGHFGGNSEKDHRGDESDDGRRNKRSSPAPYDTPSRPRRLIASPGKRTRDSAEDQDLFSSHKRTKSFHPPSPSGSDFLPCSARPPTPRPKRRRSESVDSEDEVERSIRKDASVASLDEDLRTTSRPFKKLRSNFENPTSSGNEGESVGAYNELDDEGLHTGPTITEDPEERGFGAGGYGDEGGGQYEDGEEKAGEKAGAEEGASFLSYLGRFFSLQSPQSTPTQSQPQSSTSNAYPISSGSPTYTPVSPVQPVPSSSAGLGHRFDPLPSPQHSPDPIPGPSTLGPRALPLNRNRELIYSDKGKVKSYMYDQQACYRYREAVHAENMWKNGVYDWEAPPKCYEEYAEIKAAGPTTHYRFLDDEE